MSDVKPLLRAETLPVHRKRRGSREERSPGWKRRRPLFAQDGEIPVGQEASNYFGAPYVRPEQYLPKPKKKKFVLCFDGTGNKFSGTDADSNILKIYRMLDRDDPSQFHYYQPGIGTYVQSSSLSHSSKFERIKATYLKAKDSAVGTSFDEHVMSGYRFLMRYYNVGDDIFLFGFSRGAYTARFLAEMLDHVGLLSAGNEEMAIFAWKAFERWQQRTEHTEKERQQKKFLMNYLFAFRETFSRPVRRIRFLGLFDTVNSVPQFENAFLQRSKFPYTARSTAKVIRHAVAIDERRAKFRQDLVSQVRPHQRAQHYRRRHHLWNKKSNEQDNDQELLDEGEFQADEQKPLIASGFKQHDDLQLAVPPATPPRFRSRSRSHSPGRSFATGDDVDCGASDATDQSHDSLNILANRANDFHDDDSETDEQDIQEVWFAGAHADIGGGWPLEAGEDTALSHIPLVWMVREAEKAGLAFDPKKVRDLNCAEHVLQARRKSTLIGPIPQIEVESPMKLSPASTGDTLGDDLMPPLLDADGHAKPVEMVDGKPMPTAGIIAHEEPDLSFEAEEKRASRFVKALHSAAVRGKIHDVLQFNNGSSTIGVIAWNLMEYMPFRRMDLQADGSWKSINWPLPKGETRDVPDDVVIHHTVIKRMQEDPTYRPGNLIVGGGGRGMRFAPEEYGIGKWKCLREEGDPIGEVYIRDGRPGTGPNGIVPRRQSYRDKSILLNEIMRDVEDGCRLVSNLISWFFDFVSRRLARQDRL